MACDLVCKKQKRNKITLLAELVCSYFPLDSGNYSRYNKTSIAKYFHAPLDLVDIDIGFFTDESRRYRHIWQLIHITHNTQQLFVGKQFKYTAQRFDVGKSVLNAAAVRLGKQKEMVKIG